MFQGLEKLIFCTGGLPYLGTRGTRLKEKGYDNDAREDDIIFYGVFSGPVNGCTLPPFNGEHPYHFTFHRYLS